MNVVLQDLHCSLSLMVESIFGFGGVGSAASWSIGPAASLTANEFEQLRHLLAPEGPLLRVIYKLAADPACKYAFPVSCLPVSMSLQVGC